MPKFRLRPSTRRFRVLLRLPDGTTSLVEYRCRAPNEVRRRVSIRKDGADIVRIWEA